MLPTLVGSQILPRPTVIDLKATVEEIRALAEISRANGAQYLFAEEVRRSKASPHQTPEFKGYAFPIAFCTGDELGRNPIAEPICFVASNGVLRSTNPTP